MNAKEKIKEFAETWDLSSEQKDHLEELFDDDQDPRNWKFEWHLVSRALEGFAIGLLITHEKKTEKAARDIVDDVVKKARLG